VDHRKRKREREREGEVKSQRNITKVEITKKSKEGIKAIKFDGDVKINSRMMRVR
jgi:hypothetical protein